MDRLVYTVLKQLEWCISGTAFVVREGGDIAVSRCPICNHSKELDGRHDRDCKLGFLIGYYYQLFNLPPLPMNDDGTINYRAMGVCMMPSKESLREAGIIIDDD